jgi:hypothetical protein
MLLSNLENLINTHNSNWLHPLVKSYDTKLPTGCYLPAGAIIDAPAPIGIATPSTVTRAPSSALLNIGGNPTKWAAVGTVIDQSAGPQNNPHQNPDIDSVFLVVGINYGQKSTANDYTTASPTGAMPSTVFDSTGLRGKLNTVLTNFKLKIKLPDSFALIATNYFPWITSDSWGSICANSIAEAWLLNSFGYPDPHAPILNLISGLSAVPLAGIVFHGANCAVPILALETINRIRASHGMPAIPCILCDNLAPGGTLSNYLLM